VAATNDNASLDICDVHASLVRAVCMHAEMMHRLGYSEQATALRADASFMARRARLHLKQLKAVP
jgi:hypothetical protein